MFTLIPFNLWLRTNQSVISARFISCVTLFDFNVTFLKHLGFLHGDLNSKIVMNILGQLNVDTNMTNWIFKLTWGNENSERNHKKNTFFNAGFTFDNYSRKKNDHKKLLGSKEHQRAVLLQNIVRNDTFWSSVA